MIPQEVANVALSSGFKPILLESAVRLIFAREPRTLVVHSDGTWTCYLDVCGGKQPEHWGEDFSSLCQFLKAEPPPSTPPRHV